MKTPARFRQRSICLRAITLLFCANVEYVFNKTHLLQKFATQQRIVKYSKRVQKVVFPTKHGFCFAKILVCFLLLFSFVPFFLLYFHAAKSRSFFQLFNECTPKMRFFSYNYDNFWDSLFLLPTIVRTYVFTPQKAAGDKIFCKFCVFAGQIAFWRCCSSEKLLLQNLFAQYIIAS